MSRSSPYTADNTAEPAESSAAIHSIAPKAETPAKAPQKVEFSKEIYGLINILKWRRGSGSPMEAAFVKELKSRLPKNAFEDQYGNLHVKIGDSAVLFSCHTDTVDRRKGGTDKQTVVYDQVANDLLAEKGAACLGADDGTGIWLMLHMINKKIPGYYIFHRDEEIGGGGSRWILSNMKQLLKGFEVAIAFDRRGKSDIITHQGTRTCSDEFAKQLAAEFKAVDSRFDYAPCKNGTFTDTKNYASVIPECTNISVGYSHQHTNNESQSVAFAEQLHAAVIKVNWAALTAKRNPKTDSEPAYDPPPIGAGYNPPKPYEMAYRYPSAGPKSQQPALPPAANTAKAPVKGPAKVKSDLDRMSHDELLVFCRRFPEVAAAELYALETTWSDFQASIEDYFMESFLDDNGGGL